MNKLDTFISWFLPELENENQETIRLHRLFVNCSFLTALFATGYFLMSIYLSGYYFAFAMMVSVAMFLALPFLLKWGVGLGILTNVYTAIIAVVYIFLVYWEGGIRTANVAPWIVLLPAVAMMISGLRASIAWLIVSLIIVAVFASFNFKGIKFEVRFDTSKDPVFNLLSLSGLLSIISFIIFISESGKRKAQLKLEEQNEALEKLNAEKNNFLSIVAHDLKNPLASVRAFAEISSYDKTTPEKRKVYLQHIATSADRMFELIKNLLDVNMIESGKMGLKYTDSCLNDLINNYLVQAEPVALSKQIVLVPEIPDDKIYLKIDKARFEQILENYISNAMKYSAAGSKVYVGLNESPEHIEITVKDEGPGIGPDEIEKLFKQYSITSSLPREGEHAMGLGLAIVKKIADAFGAQVGCTSVKGEGCKFYIRFLRQNQME